MKHLLHFLFSVLLYGIGLHLIQTLLPELGFSITSISNLPYPLLLLILGAVFRITHRLLRSILGIINMPLSIISFGLSTIILNVFLLYLYVAIINNLAIGATIQVGTIVQILIMSVVLSIINLIVKTIA